MCCRFNPCFCCPTEVGVYILSMTHSLYITAAFVLGVVLGFETMQIVFQTDRSLHMKSLRLVVFVWYIASFVTEVGLREYLYNTLEMNRDTTIQRCRSWIRLKIFKIVLAIPFIVLHLWMEWTDFKVALYSVGIFYHVYYSWVVYHYLTFEVIGKVEDSSISNTTIPMDPGV